MISNNTTYKLRAHKSSRDLQDYEFDTSETYDKTAEDEDTSRKSSSLARESRYNKGVGRTRATEFKPTRVSDRDRRSGYRGRASGSTSTSRRNDRDYADSYYGTRKFDPRSSEALGTFRVGKFFEPDKKTEIKLNLPEDTRISKLLRRLNIETDQDNSLAISKKLLEVLLLPENSQYVRKAFHILGESMFEILHVSPGPLAKLQAAKALGRMGYVMGIEKDFERYQHWLFGKMNETFEEIQILLMKSLKETFVIENKKPILEQHIENLINNLVSVLELTENSDLFKAILDVLVTVVEMYPTEFYEHFRDTTDLLFGWHVDHTQPLSMIEFISQSLQKIRHHFMCNLDFSVQLIENFLEDISNYSMQLSETGDMSTVEHVTVLILAMNTVLKCLGTAFHPTNNKNVKIDFINGAITRIAKTVMDSLETYVPDNLTIAGNDCIGILLSYLDNKSQSMCTLIYKVIDMEMAMMQDFSDSTVISLLVLISRVIKELSANLPLELIEKLIGPNSELIKLRQSPFRNTQNAVICVYQALLNLKNVSLLQETYRYVLGDLEVNYKQIVADVEPFSINNPFNDIPQLDKDPTSTILFLLRCLSQLANASSIIVMWALKPSILDLVGVMMKPHDCGLAEKKPHLQYCLLYLLFSHCKCYNHFISNSSLVTSKQEIPNMLNRFALMEGFCINDVPNTSPNSGNFAIILDIICKTLPNSISTDVSVLLLQWLKDILINSENYLETLYMDEKFLQLADVLVTCGYSFNPDIVLSVHDNLDKLLLNKQLSWSNTFLSNVCDLCKLHMNSNNEEIRDRYTKLMAAVPWDIAIVELNRINAVYSVKEKDSNIKNTMNYEIYLAQQLHLNGTTETQMYPLQFKTLMKYLLHNEPLDIADMQDIFTCCWLNDGNMLVCNKFYDELAMNSQQVLKSWLSLEAARFCVNFKLRTPLGKPNETFTKIESALNQLGNGLISAKRDGSMMDASRVRLLLHFVDDLEKCIYNASEGCAMASPPASKAVRAFFVANANTCREWFARMRTVAAHVALHSGEVNIALRHGQCLLEDLHNSGKTNTMEFEIAAMIVTLALLHLRESEALYGLYSWCKVSAGKRFQWVRCAAEQAAKKYEQALEGYKKILDDVTESAGEESGTSDSHNKKMEADIQNFISDQIIICNKELNNWSELFDWHIITQSQTSSSENGRKYWFNKTDWECNKILSQVENENLAFEELSSWEYKSKCDSWSVYENLSSTESNLYNIALKLTNNKDSIFKIEDNIKIIQKSLQDFLPLAPSELLQTYSLLQYVTNGLENIAHDSAAHTVFLVSENFENEIDKIDSCVLRKILWWSEYFGKVQNQGFNIFCSNLRLDVIKRARKEKNFKLAASHIHKFFRDKDLAIIVDDSLGSDNILADFFIQKVSEVNVWTMDVARGVAEVIKLLHSVEPDHQQTTFNLCAAASTAISKYAELYGVKELRKVSSQILLKLSGWMQNHDESSMSIAEMNSPLGKLIMVLPEIGMVENAVTSNIIPMNEIAVGKLLQFSVHHCSTLAKSWNAFGTWCYRWGKKIVDHSSDIKNNLSEEHCLEIKKLLPIDTSEEDLTQIFLILSQTRSIIDEEDIDSNEIKTSEMIQKQLQCVNILRDATDEQLQSLVQIWRSTQKRIYHYYALSADAYFRYLHLALQTDNITRSTECNTITVTLRLLRLIVKYALELQSILEEGLQTTPTEPWKVIIPQLFSRLNHPEGYVRHRVSDLLCRVAEDAPHLITFPAVVGALEGGLKFDFSEITLPKDCLSQDNESNDENDLNEDDDDDDDDEDNNYDDSDNENDDDSTNTLQSCFKTMVETLSKQDPETIAQVQTLVKELRRIALLWDELWLGTLAQLQSEIRKRQQQLEYEIEKVNDNASLDKEEKASLIIEKHRIIVKPIVYILEQLEDVIKVKAETPYELQFQQKYLADVQTAISKMKKPDNPENPQSSLQPLKILQKKFQQRFHKRSSYSLRMQHISPVLHKMSDTLIAMPGLTSTSKKNITIRNIQNEVSILPTKTKPKKLVFHGSDGKTYTYLFKGLEDLHLDERIMQFLSIANTMMAQNSDPGLYRARHYSVIPLGPRSGLISWVDGTVPLFALYKRWQQREATKQNTIKNNNSSSGSNAAGTTTTTTVLRPSELFYNKLNPLLKEHGVKNIDNRKEWPLSALKKVLTELMAETPGDLLAKEFWCNSISPDVWWQVTRRYSYSVAVMSIIGYIIGLGDRHLDNVLVDLTSGDVVHIDYNVCFEKGKTLRVPEKVPFRLTPNIKGALGVTGVEGIFRLASESVLKTMRKGRETLLTLLEAFVYDPLIDWTVGGEVLAGAAFGGVKEPSEGAKRSKRDLEREVTVAMFGVRCTEMRVEWNENKEEILNEIPSLVQALEQHLNVLNAASVADGRLQELHQRLALVKEAEARGGAASSSNSNSLTSDPAHPVLGLPARVDAHRRKREAVASAQQSLEDFVKTSLAHKEAYLELWNCYERGEVMSWLSEIAEVNNKTADNGKIFDLVKEFLHNAGKDDVIVQCEQSEQELYQLSQHLQVSVVKCLQVYRDYFNMLSQCPKTYMESHRVNYYLEWAQYLLEKRNYESCEVVFVKLRDFLDSMKLLNKPQVVNVAYSLEGLYKENMMQVNKLYEELTSIRTKDVNNSLEKLYNNAKAGVSSFLNCEKGAVGAMSFVIASELVLLNRNLLTLEIAAQRSGDWLLKLTSRDGDWFLDDLLLHSTKAVEIIGNLPTRQDYDDKFYNIMNGIKTATNIYKGLYDLNFNFHTIIMPESMKKMQAEEPTVIQMIYTLNKIIMDIGVSIPEMISQLEKLLTCVLMQMTVNANYDYILERVSFTKKRFQSLFQNQTEPLTQGQMLLTGFNGLFEKLNQEINNLVNTLGNLDIPKSWKKLDHVKEAKNIAPHIFNSQVRGLLEDIFFLKRVKTISEFFGVAQEMCNSLKGVNNGMISNDEQLAKPVKQFIAEFISRNLLGILPETITYSVCFILLNLGLDITHEIEQKDIGAESKVPLDELYTKAYNVLLKKGVFSQNVLSQATSLETNLKIAWEKIQEPKKIEQKLTMMQSSTLRVQNQLAIHNLMFDEVLSMHNFASVRAKYIVDLQSDVNTLQQIYRQLVEAKSKQQKLIEKAFQRLNWAKGANPNVVEISAAFELAVKTKNDHLANKLKIANNILASYGTVLHHELLRSSSLDSTKEYDKHFLKCFEKWRYSCQYLDSQNDTNTLSQCEESILNMLTPELVKDPKWLHRVSEMITETIVQVQKELKELRETSFTGLDNLNSLMENFRSIYNIHYKLMSDVKSLIKTMAKIEDYSMATQHFIQEYKQYLDRFTLLFNLFDKKLTKNEIEQLLEHLYYIKQHTATVYDSLLSLETAEGRARLIDRRLQETLLMDHDRLDRNQENGASKGGQQRNAYAVNVWRRVKMKLEGRDPDAGRKYTVQEQVEYVIREATSLDNLALLYEGWTPWV